MGIILLILCTRITYLQYIGRRIWIRIGMRHYGIERDAYTTAYAYLHVSISHGFASLR